jgi:hypothetical protein
MPRRRPGHVARVEQRQAAEQGPHRRPRPQVQPRRRVLVDGGGLVGLPVMVRGQVREHQEAPWRQRGHQFGGDAAGIVAIRHEMQDGDQQHRDWLVKPEHRTDAWVPGNRLGVPQVVADDRGVAHAVQHVPGVRQHHRVVVDVHHAAVRRDRPGQLVHVAHGGQPGADIEELPDPLLAGQVADGPPEEEPVLPHGAPHDVLAEHVEGPAHRITVGGEVVLPAEHVVVHPRDVRYLRFKRRPTPHHGPDCVSARLGGHRYLYGGDLRFVPTRRPALVRPESGL